MNIPQPYKGILITILVLAVIVTGVLFCANTVLPALSNRVELQSAQLALTSSPTPTVVTAEVTTVPTFIPTLASTNTPLPTFTPTAIQLPTLAPTNTPTPVDRYAGCPKSALGLHPDHQTGIKVPLIWIIDPYPSDKDASGNLIPESSLVVCEYEAWFAQKAFRVEIPEGRHALIAFYDHGDEWDSKGYLLDECPEGYGAKCEGVFVATKSFDLKPGALVHVYLYLDGQEAIDRFLGSPNTRTADRFFSFACDYLDYSQVYGAHDNRNINVPNWVPDDAGSIFGHTGCVNYPGNPGELEINPAEADSSSTSATCEAPTDDTWLWTENYWFYTSNSTPISFDIPSWISEVDYEDFNSGEDTLDATQTVLNAGTARAYCNNE